MTTWTYTIQDSTQAEDFIQFSIGLFADGILYENYTLRVPNVDLADASQDKITGALDPQIKELTVEAQPIYDKQQQTKILSDAVATTVESIKDVQFDVGV